MKVLITGASGFIGKPLVSASLLHGFEVIGVSLSSSTEENPSYRHLTKDVRSLNKKDLVGVDYIFHLAFQTNIPKSVSDPLGTTEENIGMTLHLLDLATKVGVRKFVFPSTASIYGRNPTPWHEELPGDPLEPYSWQKLSCEYALKMWSMCYGLPTVTFRLFLLFGENYRDDSVYYHFFKAKKEGRPIPVACREENGSVECSARDFVYVDDVSRAFINAAESKNTGQGEVINIASGTATSLLDVAKAISPNITHIEPRPAEVLTHVADIAKAKKLLDWEPKIDIISWLKNR